MRLLLVTNDYPPKPGGIQQYLGNLVDQLEGPTLVLAPADEPAMNRAGEAVVRRSDEAFMWPTPAIAEWVEAEAAGFGPEAVLFGAPYPLPWLTSRLQKSLGVPVGVLCHGAEVTLPGAIPAVRQGLAAILAGTDVRFAVSRYTQRRVARLTGSDVTYIGGGVDTDVFTPSPRPRSSTPVVGCVSRFVPRKGQHRLIEAVARLGDRGIDVDLLLVGRGRKEEQLRAQVARNGVNARFAVDVDWGALPDLYRSMDVFAMPARSRWGGLEIEGLGLVYLEAAACGLPVLAGDSGGSPETVIPGVTGFVVRSTSDLVEGLSLLLGDPERARAMGLAGRERVVADYSWKAVAARLEAGFSEAAEALRSS